MTRETKCPWCLEEMKVSDYAEHLEKHYRKENDKRIGPFPIIKEA